MAESVPQNFENHARIVPVYHYVTFPLLAINFFFTIYQMVTHFSVASLMAFGVALALVLLFFVARLMVLTVQDRVIRLEERMRMRELFPADLQPRVADFTVKQLVALRFASDAELPALARKVLTDKITDQKAIKRMVTQWRGDDQRA
jgi:hypothetical protein